ncbi:hypothetical protein KM043_017590 [Ampulex compressa]|nr:hypothetical protein KM043_017590 [Ampulex compressa]
MHESDAKTYANVVSLQDLALMAGRYSSRKVTMHILFIVRMPCPVDPFGLWESPKDASFRVNNVERGTISCSILPPLHLGALVALALLRGAKVKFITMHERSRCVCALLYQDSEMFIVCEAVVQSLCACQDSACVEVSGIEEAPVAASWLGVDLSHCSLRSRFLGHALALRHKSAAPQGIYCMLDISLLS